MAPAALFIPKVAMPRKPKPPTPAGTPPQALGPIVEQVFQERRQGPALALNRLREHWAGIVGEPLAKATQPTRLAKGVLWIAAPDSGWAFNLQFVKADVLNAVRTFLASEQVREVRFKVGDVSSAGETAVTADGTAEEPPVPADDAPGGARVAELRAALAHAPKPGPGPAADAPGPESVPPEDPAPGTDEQARTAGAVAPVPPRRKTAAPGPDTLKQLIARMAARRGKAPPSEPEP